MNQDRFPLWAVCVALALLGVAVAAWTAFLVPLRLPGGIEGLADVVAFGANFGFGIAAAWATRDLPPAAMPGIGWLLAALAFSTFPRPSDEVIVPGKLGNDPGIAVVGNLFLWVGAAGAIAAVLLASRFTSRPAPPTPPV